MISKYRFSLPRLDLRECGYFPLGVWFHIVARLVYSKPWMAFFLAELIAAILVLFGAYQVWMHGLHVSAWKSVRHWKPGNRP
ncbi:conjugal transfer pilin chaperone TraQ (plasmid) [Escherichia coli]|nr:conjugal transfer pilin chaperone TraQ [Escherichia coli]